jgi:hypothetical protein
MQKCIFEVKALLELIPLLRRNTRIMADRTYSLTSSLAKGRDQIFSIFP